jgi:hypothetical protein
LGIDGKDWGGIGWDRHVGDYDGRTSHIFALYF